MIRFKMIEDGEYPFFGYPRSIRALVEIHGWRKVHLVAMSKDKMWEKTVDRGNDGVSQFQTDLIAKTIPERKIRFNHEQARKMMVTIPVISILSSIVCLWKFRVIIGRILMRLVDKDKHPQITHPWQALFLSLALCLIPGISTLVAILALLIPAIVE